MGRPARRRRQHSVAHPAAALIASLAARIAEIGRMPSLGSLAHSDATVATAGRQSNSAQRLHAVWDSFVVPDAVASAVGALPGPVLLVDDLIDSGWTQTVAAMRLRAAGAVGVLPLALAAVAS